MEMVEQQVFEQILAVDHEHGLHARPADLFVRCSNQFTSSIYLYNLTRNVDKKANAKGILGVLSLGVRKGDVIKIVAEGDDGAQAIEALTALVRSNFQE